MRPLIVGMLVFSMTVLPISSTFAADQTPPQRANLRNVELDSQGQVIGRLLDEQGKAVANKTVEVRVAQSVQKQKTDAQGKFKIKSKVGGNCAIIVDDRAYGCRLWAGNTAPPKSLQRFEIVDRKGPIVRGQDCNECDDGGFGLSRISGSQLLGLGLLAGAVVAIVLAVENDDDGS